MNEPHPKLVPLLARHEISWDLFSKQGRPPNGVREKRSRIVTDLHQEGMSWEEMMEVTGLSNGGIQRLTGAMWNPKSRERLRENGRRTGESWKGKKRPGQLKRQWKSGNFDSLRGRIRPPEERARLREGWTPECRESASQHSLNMWKEDGVRKRLLDFHRSPEERKRRSREQSQRMKDNPGKWVRGKSEWLDTPKGFKDRAYVRSSYEAAAVRLLEEDPEVIRYEHERRIALSSGSWMLPDFIVEYEDGSTLLVEVKASWVLGLSVEHKISKRLMLSADLASDRGWGFAIWTERKELKDALR